jgi:hypothetical protein
LNFMTFRKSRIIHRRGISQIIGSLFMLAIVVPIGVVVLSQGLLQATDFNSFLTVTREQGIEAVQEDLVFEHIRFDPTSDQLTIHLRNISGVELDIERVSVVKMDSQDLLVMEVNQASFLPLKDTVQIDVNANLQFTGQWNDANYEFSEYKISVTTVRGNFFDTIARPFNT